MNKVAKIFVAGISFYFLFFVVDIVYAYSSFKVHSLVVFGDGGMDNGNTQQQSKFPVMPPYWNGRFSNGPVAAEFLAQRLNLISNPLRHPDYKRDRLFTDISYFGVVILPQNAVSLIHPSYSPPTFSQEVNQYLSESPRNPPASTLIMVAVGTNDAGSPACLANPLTCLQNVVSVMVKQLEILCHKGFTHFLIIMPGSSDSKPGLAYSFDSAKEQQVYNVLIKNYLQEFSSVKVDIEQEFPRAHVALFDAIAAENNIIDKFSIPTSFPCYNNDAAIYDRPNGPVCDNPNQHLYFDSFFYSSRGHQLFASAIYKYLKKIGWVDDGSNLHWWQKI